MPERDRRRLIGITLTLGVLTLLHDADHVRQGRSLPVELYGVAILAVLSLSTTLTLLVRRHPYARPVAITEGLTTFAGVGAVHVAPQWSSLADSYGAAHVDALSWALILAMMLAGLAMAAVALVAAERFRPVPT